MWGQGWGGGSKDLGNIWLVQSGGFCFKAPFSPWPWGGAVALLLPKPEQGLGVALISQLFPGPKPLLDLQKEDLGGFKKTHFYKLSFNSLSLVFIKTFYPLSARKFRVCIPCLLPTSSVGKQINRSSTYWMTCPPPQVIGILNPLPGPVQKKCGLSLNASGKTVCVRCCLCPWASVHSKANKNWWLGPNGIQKKASFKPNTENHWVWEGMFPKIVYGFGTMGCIGIIASLIAHKSWTNLYVLSFFLIGRIEVWQGEFQGTSSSLWTKYCNNFL